MVSITSDLFLCFEEEGEGNVNKWAVLSTHSGGFARRVANDPLPCFLKETRGAADLWPVRLQARVWGCVGSETWEGASVSVQARCDRRILTPRQDANRCDLWPWKSSGSGASSAPGFKINLHTLIKWSDQMSELLWTHIWSFFFLVGARPLMLKRVVRVFFLPVKKHFHTQPQCVKPLKGFRGNLVWLSDFKFIENRLKGKKEAEMEACWLSLQYWLIFTWKSVLLSCISSSNLLCSPL